MRPPPPPPPPRSASPPTTTLTPLLTPSYVGAVDAGRDRILVPMGRKGDKIGRTASNKPCLAALAGQGGTQGLVGTASGSGTVQEASAGQCDGRGGGGGGGEARATLSNTSSHTTSREPNLSRRYLDLGNSSVPTSLRRPPGKAKYRTGFRESRLASVPCTPAWLQAGSNVGAHTTFTNELREPWHAGLFALYTIATSLQCRSIQDNCCLADGLVRLVAGARAASSSLQQCTVAERTQGGTSALTRREISRAPCSPGVGRRPHTYAHTAGRDWSINMVSAIEDGPGWDPREGLPSPGGCPPPPGIGPQCEKGTCKPPRLASGASAAVASACGLLTTNAHGLVWGCDQGACLYHPRGVACRHG